MGLAATTCLSLGVVDVVRFYLPVIGNIPGEPHVNLFTGRSLSSVQCERWIHRIFEYADLRFDRLILPRVDVVDDEKLAKIEKATSDRKLRAYDGERTRILRDRDLNCSDWHMQIFAASI